MVFLFVWWTIIKLWSYFIQQYFAEEFYYFDLIRIFSIYLVTKRNSTTQDFIFWASIPSNQCKHEIKYTNNNLGKYVLQFIIQYVYFYNHWNEQINVDSLAVFQYFNCLDIFKTKDNFPLKNPTNPSTHSILNCVQNIKC